MLIRLFIVMLLLSSCRMGEIACPEPQRVKLRKRPADYGYKSSDKDVTASTKSSAQKEKYFKFQQQRNLKSSDNIEEWDCPKPGSKNLPKSVKENIRKNRRKFDAYYKNRPVADTVATSSN